MRLCLGTIIVVSVAAASHAYAQEVVLSCQVEETGTNHARRTWEIEFDQQNQIVTVGKTVSTAAITDANITFRVDLGTGVPFSFAIDRRTGSIRVTGNSGVLYSGQCKVANGAT